MVKSVCHMNCIQIKIKIKIYINNLHKILQCELITCFSAIFEKENKYTVLHDLTMVRCHLLLTERLINWLCGVCFTFCHFHIHTTTITVDGGETKEKQLTWAFVTTAVMGL